MGDVVRDQYRIVPLSISSAASGSEPTPVSVPSDKYCGCLNKRMVRWLVGGVCAVAGLFVIGTIVNKVLPQTQTPPSSPAVVDPEDLYLNWLYTRTLCEQLGGQFEGVAGRTPPESLCQGQWGAGVKQSGDIRLSTKFNPGDFDGLESCEQLPTLKNENAILLTYCRTLEGKGAQDLEKILTENWAQVVMNLTNPITNLQNLNCTAIKKAYRPIATVFHPDKVTDCPKTANLFNCINLARAVLEQSCQNSDPSTATRMKTDNVYSWPEAWQDVGLNYRCLTPPSTIGYFSIQEVRDQHSVKYDSYFFCQMSPKSSSSGRVSSSGTIDAYMPKGGVLPEP